MSEEFKVNVYHHCINQWLKTTKKGVEDLPDEIKDEYDGDFKELDTLLSKLIEKAESKLKSRDKGETDG